MKALNKKLVSTVASYLNGKRLEKFLTSVEVINLSLEHGSWILGGSKKANSGFYQGTGFRLSNDDESWIQKELRMDLFPFFHCLNFGVPMSRYQERDKKMLKRLGKDKPFDLKKVLNEIRLIQPRALKKLDEKFFQSWIDLTEEVGEAVKLLNEARPKPVITEIGLSPKVTKTFKEMNLDLEIKSIKPAEIKFRMVKKLNDFGEPVIVNNKPIMQKEYYVAWSKGVVHGQSRFHGNYKACEACGKFIPSSRFVPLEAKDNRSGKLVSLWVGCDCAKNIFGVKDLGIERPR